MGLQTKIDEHQIETVLREAARVLDFPIPPRLPYMTATEGMTLQAEIILELAKRIASIEKR